jgi:hypothetical protein
MIAPSRATEWTMKLKHVAGGAAILGLCGGVALLAPSASIHPAYAACDPGTRVDGSTADWAKRTMMRSGYNDVQIDQKGCDNVWHVVASKDGQRGRFAIEPGGKIYPEGN